MTARIKNNNDEKPLRLFKSDFLEFFTHVSPITVLALFSAIIALLIWHAADVNDGQPGWRVLLGILLGLLLWFPTEYALHRFLFIFSRK